MDQRFEHANEGDGRCQHEHSYNDVHDVLDEQVDDDERGGHEHHEDEDGGGRELDVDRFFEAGVTLTLVSVTGAAFGHPAYGASSSRCLSCATGTTSTGSSSTTSPSVSSTSSGLAWPGRFDLGSSRRDGCQPSHSLHVVAVDLMTDGSCPKSASRYAESGNEPHEYHAWVHLVVLCEQ